MREDLNDKFVEQLESYGLVIGRKLDKIDKTKSNYVYLESILNQIEESKVDFCSSYFACSEEEKKEFKGILLELFKDQEIVDNIIQEIVNLYYLKEYELLELEETAPQKEVAFENLDTLCTKIEKYLGDTNFDQLIADDKKLSGRMDRLVSLGCILESDDKTPIEDLGFLEEMLEIVELSDEEKKEVLLYCIKRNLDAYDYRLAKRDAKDESVEKYEDEEKNISIDSETLNSISSLLAQRSTIQRIVEIVKEGFGVVVDIRTPSNEEREFIKESIGLAREEIENSIKDGSASSPEDALNMFFQKYDETNRQKLEYLNYLLENTQESTLSDEEQAKVFKDAFDFAAVRGKSIGELSSKTKSKIRAYMLSIFQNKESRDVYYSKYSFSDKEQYSAYEIETYKELLEVVDEDDYSTRAKICTKLQEIMESLNLTKGNDGIDDVVEGNLFFIMKDDGYSTLEEDLQIDHQSKGISPAYYTEVRNQLQAIEDRGDGNLISAQPGTPGLKYLKKEGVRHTTGTRTKVYFIPVGKKDAIVVGMSQLSGRGDINREQDQKVRYYQKQIKALKDKLYDPDSYMEEKIAATKVRNRIMSQLNRKELDDMFEEETEDEEIKVK